MQFKKYICLLTSFETLNLTYHSQKRLYDSINDEFGTLYFINIDNLKFFSKPKKYDFTDELKNLPKNIIFFNPQNAKEFKDFIKNKILITICNFNKTFDHLKIYLLLKKKNIIQIEIKNVGNFQMGHNVSLKNIFLTLKHLIFYRVFRKITTLLSIIGIINKLDISFISNKTIINSLKTNKFKNFLYENKLLFTKEFCLVNSRFNDEINIENQNLSNKHIVHLDYYLSYNHETMLSGEFSQQLLKEHHDRVKNFLLETQKQLNKEVIICIHPLYPIEYFQTYYKNFKIVKYKTTELIKDADLVTFFDSSAIINAILMKKKIIQLSTKHMGKNFHLHCKTYKKKLNLQSIDIDTFQTNQFETVYKKSFVNNDTLNEYISNYHRLSGEETGVSKIVNTIKKRYF